jgi:hypothetical protein
MQHKHLDETTALFLLPLLMFLTVLGNHWRHPLPSLPTDCLRYVAIRQPLTHMQQHSLSC